MATIIDAIAVEPGVRLPGTRRLASRARAAAEGVTITPALHEEIRALIDRPA
jgi:(2R)-3-sulfolactate dehydrogenase (NADP+)